MSDFKPRPGTFLPYIEAVKRSQPKRVSPLTLLELLARQAQQSLPLFELQTQSERHGTVALIGRAEKLAECRIYRVRRRGLRGGDPADPQRSSDSANRAARLMP